MTDLMRCPRWRSLRNVTLAAPILWLAVAVTPPVDAQAPARRDRFHEPRLEMVARYIAAEGISHPRVLTAMQTVPRHEFVRPSLWNLAYNDQALDIGHKQTISPPFIVAYMTETLDPQPDDRVLEIGTGSGYQAAVLGELVKEVYSIEIVEPLGRQAASRLKRLGYANVQTRVGDGYLGWPEQAPFDKIIVTCSPESVPRPLIDQLKDGGKLLIPLGERYQQVFHLLEKRDGQLVEERLQSTLFVPMTGQSEDLRQVKPDGANPRVVNGGFETGDDESGRPDHWHYQRRATVVTEGAAEGTRCICFENEDAGRTASMVQGLALDGSQVASVSVSCQYRGRELRQGTQTHERPALLLHFYDDRRLPIGSAQLGPWLVDTDTWATASDQIRIPTRTREAILQVGLNGGRGTLYVDDVRLSPLKK